MSEACSRAGARHDCSTSSIFCYRRRVAFRDCSRRRYACGHAWRRRATHDASLGGHALFSQNRFPFSGIYLYCPRDASRDCSLWSHVSRRILSLAALEREMVCVSRHWSSPPRSRQLIPPSAPPPPPTPPPTLSQALSLVLKCCGACSCSSRTCRPCLGDASQDCSP